MQLSYIFYYTALYAYILAGQIECGVCTASAILYIQGWESSTVRGRCTCMVSSVTAVHQQCKTEGRDGQVPCLEDGTHWQVETHQQNV